jgi:iron(III) transport system permease protein
VGVLLLLAPIDHAINDFATNVLGVTAPGLIFTGSIGGLLYAYAVRFMAVGFNSVDSSLEKVTPNMEQAARTMGAGSGRVLRRVYVPLVSGGMAAGALLVFVDVMKELPATLLLRPFGMDTLALWTYFLAGESFWQAAAIPSLTILVIGLLPVLLLMRVGDRDDHHSA